MLTLSGRTCNAIYRNSDRGHGFCSSLSFQQSLVDVYTSNRFQITVGFVKTVKRTLPENKRSKKAEKNWEQRSILGSMESVKRKMSTLFMIRKNTGKWAHGNNAYFQTASRCVNKKMDVLTEQHYIVKFCEILKRSKVEMIALLKEDFQNETTHDSTIHWWYRAYMNNRESTKTEQVREILRTIVTDITINTVSAVIKEDPSFIHSKADRWPYALRECQFSTF